MCPRCRNTGTVVIKFPGVTKQCKCCDSDGGNNPPSGSDYIIKPQGGEEGDVLVKKGNNVAWESPEKVVLFNDTVGF
jgi:hypothetical protein